MGITKSVSISTVLFSLTQQRLFSLLFGQPDRSFFFNELLRLTGAGTGGLHRELGRLTASGLVSMREIGNQRHYQANRDAPIFNELRGIVLKTVGLVDVLREALHDLDARIQIAFVYGSLAKGTDHAGSDVDLMVIGNDLTYGDLFRDIEAVERTLGRKVNPTFYDAAEFRRRRDENNNFLLKVLEQPKIFVKGGDDELARIGQPREAD